MQPRFIKSILIANFIITPVSVFAESNTLEPIVVTATRTEQSISNTLPPTTLIDRNAIEQSQATNILDLLKQQSGIDIASNGGIGSTNSLLTRGTETSHTLLMIDGVKMGSATTGAATFQHIPLQLIERIEIIRGPRSSLYGSEAIGGVIQIFTRKGSKQTSANIFASHGTYNTSEASTGISGSTGNATYSLQAAYLKTDGINALSISNPDEDGYLNQSVNASFRDVVSDKLEIGFNLYYVEGDVDYDVPPSFFSPNALTDDYSSETINAITSADIKLFLNDNWDSSLKFSNSRDESEQFINSTPDSYINTERNQFIWQNDIQLMETILFTLGYDYLDDEVESTANYAKTQRNNKAIFAQVQNNFTNSDLVVALRNDNNEAFGHHTTGNIDWRYKLNSNYSITGSYGKAFKAPTFNDLYWPNDGFSFGNPNLVPETSESTEIIVRRKSANLDWRLSIYQTKIDDLIEWAPTGPLPTDPWTPTNISQAKIEGLEGSITTKVRSLDIQFEFDLLDPINSETGEKLIRRSSKNATLIINRKHNLLYTGISLEGHGERFDAGQVKLAGYGLLSIHAGYQVSKNLELKLKIENALDKEYETALDYNSLGRGAYLSASYLVP